MAKVSRSALVSHCAEQMFELINDIESYPSFMTGCVEATLLSKNDDFLEARLTLGKSGVQQTFTTRNELHHPKLMVMRLVDGPFKHFEGRWGFHEIDASSCKVTLDLDFAFSNPILALTAGKWFEQTASEQVDALCRRADQVYGS